MRILHISTRLILGGSQENTILSCEGQMKNGHEVHLAFGPIFGPEGSMLKRVQQFHTQDNRTIQTHDLPHMVRELSPWKDYLAYRECRRLIRKIKPDIVHTHSSKAGILGRATAWKEGGRSGKIAVFHTIHGLPFHPYETKWRNSIYIHSEKWAAIKCHTILTVCDAMRDQSLAVGIGHRNQFSTVYSGMDIEPFLHPPINRTTARQLLGLEEDNFVMGTIARLAELKGHDDLIDALTPDLQKHPNWKLLWVGDGWWRERLQKRLQQSGIDSQIIMTGLVPPEEIPAQLIAMDTLIHPSYREGLPRTVPQALLAGIPVIVYNVDGAPEVCKPRKTGILIPPGNLDELRAAAN